MKFDTIFYSVSVGRLSWNINLIPFWRLFNGTYIQNMLMWDHFQWMKAKNFQWYPFPNWNWRINQYTWQNVTTSISVSFPPTLKPQPFYQLYWNWKEKEREKWKEEEKEGKKKTHIILHIAQASKTNIQWYVMWLHFISIIVALLIISFALLDWCEYFQADERAHSCMNVYEYF